MTDEATPTPAKKKKVSPADASISAAMHPTEPKAVLPTPPTVGRIVHFVGPNRKPLAALVIGVGDDADDSVTLSVFTPQGGRFTKTVGWADANDGTGWAWPPKV